MEIVLVLFLYVSYSLADKFILQKSDLNQRCSTPQNSEEVNYYLI